MKNKTCNKCNKPRVKVELPWCREHKSLYFRNKRLEYSKDPDYRKRRSISNLGWQRRNKKKYLEYQRAYYLKVTKKKRREAGNEKSK